MQFFFIEMVFFLPFCMGRILDNASSQEIKNKVIIVSKDGTKRILQPSLSIRNGPQKVMEVMAGDGKYLECEAGGSPPPTIHWLKDGKRVAQENFTATTRIPTRKVYNPQTSVHWTWTLYYLVISYLWNDRSYYEAVHPDENEILSSKLGLGFTRSRLYIDCASSRDNGKYTCVAENEYFRDSKTGQVFVVDSMAGESNAICLAKKTFGSPARVHMWTHTRLEFMGTDVQLFCRHDGDPQPEVSWTGPEGKVLPNSEKYQTMENGDLIIRNLKWADMGGYTCHVSNSEGSDETLVFLYPTLPDNDKRAKA